MAYVSAFFFIDRLIDKLGRFVHRVAVSSPILARAFKTLGIFGARIELQFPDFGLTHDGRRLRTEGRGRAQTGVRTRQLLRAAASAPFVPSPSIHQLVTYRGSR